MNPHVIVKKNVSLTATHGQVKVTFDSGTGKVILPANILAAPSITRAVARDLAYAVAAVLEVAKEENI